MNLKDLVSSDNFGETFYVVDSDYRTQAQGWTKADGTGPLDLYNSRNPGRVFYSSGAQGSSTTTDSATIQAAVDAAVDFRGDKVFLTPGSYSLAAVVALDAAGLRLVGPTNGNPRGTRTTVTAAIDAAYTVSVNDVEIGYHKMIPLTAKNFIDVSSGAQRGYLHHLFWDATGISTSTSTEFLAAAASMDWLTENCAFYVDAPQGDAFTLTSSLRWTVQDCDFMVGLTAVAWASVFTFVTSALGNVVRRCTFRGCGGATAAVFTNIFTGVTDLNGQVMISDCRIDGTALATSGDIETTFGTTTDVELVENYKSGDATTEGGILIVLT